jgi:hypothetical protein
MVDVERVALEGAQDDVVLSGEKIDRNTEIPPDALAATGWKDHVLPGAINDQSQYLRGLSGMTVSDGARHPEDQPGSVNC